MTTPPAIPVDLFTWLRDFHGIRPRDTDDMRPVDWPARQTATIHAVACAIAASIHGKTGEAKLGIPRIAERAQVSESTVSKVLPYLEATGWLRITRTTKPGTNGNMPNLYELTSPVAALRALADQVEQTYPAQRGGVPRSTGEGAPLNGDELRPELRDTTTKDSKTSVDASAAPAESVHKWINGEETIDALPLHPEWAPNNANRSVAAELGLDVDIVAEVFRRAMLDADQRRRGWGAAFTEYLRAEADGTAGATFEVDDDALAAQAVEAAAAAWRDDPWAHSSAAPIPAPVVEDTPVVPASCVPANVPVPAVVEVVDVEDQGEAAVAEVEDNVVALAPHRNTLAAMQWLERAIVGVLHPEDRAEAERMFEAGERREAVRAAIKAEQKARKLRMRAELARVRPASIPA
ncbi:hypothetical protein [Rhodococcus koreensis]|uniref:hypothetical protein n=1 Tax=Rhodococcus koreensis TaxID=99653 RepID=UPI00366B242D